MGYTNTNVVPKSAVVTGAGSGLGRALALELASRGAHLVLADVDEIGASHTADIIDSQGGTAHVVHCDVRLVDQVEELADRAEELLGAVDFVANNAGVAAGGRFESLSLKDWHHVIDVNLWGVIHGCRAFAPRMKARGHGYILNVASAAGLVSLPRLSPYNVSKAGVVALSETLHGELASHGVRVSALCPTFFMTNIATRAGGDISRNDRDLVSRVMRRSKLQAEDVARLAIEGTLANQLYIVPMRDGRVVWRMVRMLPEAFYYWLARGYARRFDRASTPGAPTQQ